MCKPLTCPQCGGQNLEISQKIIYARYFTIEDGKMFGMSGPQVETHGDTWIDCSTCREEDKIDNDIEVSEWIATKEERDLLWKMREKATQSTDVSEFLKSEIPT